MNKFKIIDIEVGGDEWLDIRKKFLFRTGSMSPVIMGVSGHTTRNELMKAIKEGKEREFSDYTKEVVFKEGHRVEAIAREIVERQFDIELSPVMVMSEDDTEIASLDGLSMDYDYIWECKQYNKEKIEDVNKGVVPNCDIWQLVRGAKITGIMQCLYTITDGTEKNTNTIKVTITQDQIKALEAQDRIFQEDLDAYVPEEKVEMEEVNIDQLPEPVSNINGELSITDNLSVIETGLKTVSDNMPEEPETDEDFVYISKASKVFRNAQKSIAKNKSDILSKVKALDEFVSKSDELEEFARQKAIFAEKVYKEKQIKIKNDHIAKGKKAVIEAINSFNQKLEGCTIGEIAYDIEGAAKNVKLLDSLKDRIATEVARAKVEASMAFDKVSSNLVKFNDLASGYDFLFFDKQLLLLKDEEDMAAIVKSRVAERKDADEKEAQRRAKEIADKKIAEEKERIEKENREAREAQEREDKAKRDEAERKMQEERRKLNEERERIDAARKEQERIDAARKEQESKKAEEVKPIITVVENKQNVEIEMENFDSGNEMKKHIDTLLNDLNSLREVIKSINEEASIINDEDAINATKESFESLRSVYIRFKKINSRY